MAGSDFTQSFMRQNWKSLRTPQETSIDDGFLPAEVTDQDLGQNDDPVDPDDVALIVFNNDKTHLGNEVPANVRDAVVEI
ncbi:hypothetical protein ILUMI_24301 [Ignelater luminosus]|uniref:Uncharacterized protein n=1 Tax=Ignelater luminosus TaxID=2038154 RepID=A0A8K0C9D5_IGNLU|nr:hypothetical protein ILUMI_24301 [Ignelater luminosus]